MVSKKVIVNNKSGLHARPASLFVKEAMKYKSNVTVKVNDKEYAAKSILNILAACIKSGTEVELIANGDDEQLAVDGLAAAIESGLGE